MYINPKSCNVERVTEVLVGQPSSFAADVVVAEPVYFVAAQWKPYQQQRYEQETSGRWVRTRSAQVRVMNLQFLTRCRGTQNHLCLVECFLGHPSGAGSSLHVLDAVTVDIYT